MLGFTQKRLSPAAAWYFIFLLVVFRPAGAKNNQQRMKIGAIRKPYMYRIFNLHVTGDGG
jgi:hypothetical protein